MQQFQWKSAFCQGRFSALFVNEVKSHESCKNRIWSQSTASPHWSLSPWFVWFDHPVFLENDLSQIYYCKAIIDHSNLKKNIFCYCYRVTATIFFVMDKSIRFHDGNRLFIRPLRSLIYILSKLKRRWRKSLL